MPIGSGGPGIGNSPGGPILPISGSGNGGGPGDANTLAPADDGPWPADAPPASESNENRCDLMCVT
jgi:hypothetical protein